MEFATLADPDLVEDGFNVAGAFTTMVLEMEPGPTTMSMLGSIDDSALDTAERTMVLQAWERQLAWLMVHMQKAVVSVAGLEAATSDDWVREEVACAVGLSSNAAGQRVHVARTLLSLFPATVAALECGQLQWRHALAMVEFCGDFDTEHAAAIEQRVLAKADGQTLAQFRRALKRAALVAAPEQARVRREKAVRERDVQLIPGADGMASVVTTLPALDAVAAYEVINAVAHAGDGATDAEGNPLGIDARRADAFLALLGLGGPLDSVGRSRVVRQIELQLVSDLPTWLALADNPVELLGYGHLPGAVVRQLRRDGADIALRRLVADPTTGQLLHFGRKTYRPPRGLREFVQARDRTCRFPGCVRAAKHCDIDHGKAWDAGGETSEENCGCLCRRHHRLKTLGGWLLRYLRDGTALWTSPAGRLYSVRPPPQLSPD
jgi:hypothetical protein